MPSQGKFNQLATDVEEALALAHEHISTYGLMIEEGTEFGRRGLTPVPRNGLGPV